MRNLLVWTMVVLLLLALAAFSSWKWGDRGAGTETWSVRGGNAHDGGRLIAVYGCGACHVIDGIKRANGRVGPKLQDIQEQIYIGGVVPNTAENMVSWIVSPQEFSPGTAMPDLDISDHDARHMAAYLFQN